MFLRPICSSFRSSTANSAWRDDDDNDDDNDEDESEEIDPTIGIEPVANARIVGVPDNSCNKSVFYDFTDSDRKSEGRWITSGNSRLSFVILARVAKRERVTKSSPLFSVATADLRIMHVSFVFAINDEIL